MRAVASAVLYCSSSGIAFHREAKTAISLVCGLVSPVNLVGRLQARDYEA